jgi:large repetitive protein
LTVSARAPIGRGTWACLLAALSTLLAACSGSSASSVTGPVGTSVGVALSSSTGSAQVQQGEQLVLTATVSSDPTNAGVRWTLVGDGSLVNQTKTSATYVAPPLVTGTTSPLITATAIADNTKTANALLLVLGLPIINQTVLFPGNVGSLYAAQVSVAGGLAPFTWVLASGALPPGIVLGTSTTAYTTVSGTPTTAGTYNFALKATDTNKREAQTIPDLSMVVKATASCLIEGRYALLYSGFVNGQVAVGATSVNVSSTGTITGYQDFNPGSTPVSESVTGTCTTRTSNNGALTLTGVTSSPVYNYAMTVGLLNGRAQLLNGGSNQSGSGPLEQQMPTDFVLSKLVGNFAFGAFGAQSGGTRAGTVGTLTIDASGHVTGGHVDSNTSQPLTDAAVTGSLTAPDPNTGRGTLALTASGSGGAQTLRFAYYIVNAGRLNIVSTDANAPIAGFMTRQAAGLSNSSLTNPAILSLWGAAAVFEPRTVLSLGRFSGANPSSGTINLVLDTGDQATSTFAQAINGMSYAVRTTDGRTTMHYASGTISRSFVLYLDGPSSGYVVEAASSAGSAGVLEAQSSGPFVNTLPGLFLSGTQFPEDASPIVLLPAVHLATGSFVATYATGYYTLDANTGRGVGTLNISGYPSSAITLYVLRPDKVIVLRMPTQFVNAVTSWVTAD